MDIDDLEQSIDGNLNVQDLCKMELIENPIVENPELSWSKQIVNQGSMVKTKNCDEFGILSMKKSGHDPCLPFMNTAIIYFESQGFLIEASILKEVIDYENPINITERLKNLLEQNITNEKDSLEDVSISEVDNKIKKEEISNVGQEQTSTNNSSKMERIANPVVKNTELTCYNVRRHKIFK